MTHLMIHSMIHLMIHLMIQRSPSFLGPPFWVRSRCRRAASLLARAGWIVLPGWNRLRRKSRKCWKFQTGIGGWSSKNGRKSPEYFVSIFESNVGLTPRFPLKFKWTRKSLSISFWRWPLRSRRVNNSKNWILKKNSSKLIQAINVLGFLTYLF